MDTVRCVNNDVRFWEGNELMPYSGNPDSAGLYCIFKKAIDIPIVTVNNESIIYLIDSCLIDAVRSNYLQFPDSSGYFIELLFSEKKGDSLVSVMSITPVSNYYMAEILSSDRNEMLYEWYSCNEKNLQGVFFLNNILCVITSYGCFDYERVSCLFSQTQSTIKLALFSPIRMIVSNNIWSHSYHHIYNCAPIINPTDTRN